MHEKNLQNTTKPPNTIRQSWVSKVTRKQMNALFSVVVCYAGILPLKLVT